MSERTPIEIADDILVEVNNRIRTLTAERDAIDAERMKMREALERIEDECQCAAYQIARSVLYTQPTTKGRKA